MNVHVDSQIPSDLIYILVYSAISLVFSHTN